MALLVFYQSASGFNGFIVRTKVLPIRSQIARNQGSEFVSNLKFFYHFKKLGHRRVGYIPVENYLVISLITKQDKRASYENFIALRHGYFELRISLKCSQ